MGRRAYRPTDVERIKVRERSGVGMPQEAIARSLGIGVSTLIKYFRPELDRGVDEANLEVANAIWRMAVGQRLKDDGTLEKVEPNPTMAIWWSKTRMGWREPPRDSDAPSVAVAGNATIIVRGGLPEVSDEDTDLDVPARPNGHGNGADPDHTT